MRFVLEQFARVELFGHDSALALLTCQGLEVLKGVRTRRHDEAALGIELEGITELTRHLCPQPLAEQGEVEFGAGLLVGHEDVALSRPGRAAGDGTTIDDDGVEAGFGTRPGTARTDDAGPDDDDIGHHPRSSRRLAQMPRTWSR